MQVQRDHRLVVPVGGEEKREVITLSRCVVFYAMVESSETSELLVAQYYEYNKEHCIIHLKQVLFYVNFTSVFNKKYSTKGNEKSFIFPQASKTLLYVHSSMCE